jgi:hypothetical protein
MSSPLANLTSLERRFVIGVMVVVFIVLNLLFVRPRFQDWGKVKVRLASASKKLETFRSVIGETKKLTNDIAQIEKGGMTVPSAEAAVDFLRTIQNAAIATGVNLQTTARSTATTRTNDQFFVEHAQQVTLIAREENLVNFLYQLSSGNNALVSVRDLVMRPDQPRQQLSATLKLVASYQKQTPARAGATGSTPAATASTRNR